MRAWRMIEKCAPLIAVDLPDPIAGPGQVVVGVRAAGICHSDLHLIDGDFPVSLPFTLGHESAGDVVSVGAGVEGVSVGCRVAVYGAQACGKCRQCEAGQINICPHREHLGIQVDGGFAELLVTSAGGIVPIPDGVSYEQAAVCVDAVLTPYHALHAVGQLERGQTVAIIGVGGLGSNAVQLAVAHGAHVVAIDVDANRQAEALELGAARAFADTDGVLHEVDLVLDLVGDASTIAAAVLAVRIGGRVVVVGLGDRTANIAAMRLPAHEVALLGSYWGTPTELVTCLHLVQQGVISPRVEPCPFDSVNEQIDRLRHGQVRGRAVLASPPWTGHDGAELATTLDASGIS